MSSFNEDTVEHFKAYVGCGGSRDQVVREMSEFIYRDCEWDSNYERSELLEELIKLVYEDN
jgi:hypothetical protein